MCYNSCIPLFNGCTHSTQTVCLQISGKDLLSYCFGLSELVVNFMRNSVPLFVFVPGPQPPAPLLEAGGVGSLMNNVQEGASSTI